MSLNLLTYCLYCMYHFRCSLAYNGSSLIARGKKSYLLIHLIALYEMRMSEHKWCYLHQRAHNEKMAQFQNTKHYKTAKKINDFNFSVFFSLANCSVHFHREKIVEQFLLLFLFGLLWRIIKNRLQSTQRAHRWKQKLLLPHMLRTPAKLNCFQLFVCEQQLKCLLSSWGVELIPIFAHTRSKNSLSETKQKQMEKKYVSCHVIAVHYASFANWRKTTDNTKDVNKKLAR